MACILWVNSDVPVARKHDARRGIAATKQRVEIPLNDHDCALQ